MEAGTADLGGQSFQAFVSRLSNGGKPRERPGQGPGPRRQSRTDPPTVLDNVALDPLVQPNKCRIAVASIPLPLPAANTKLRRQQRPIGC